MSNSLIQSNIVYSSQLWAPTDGEELTKIEKLAKDFTSKIPDLKLLSYWERLSKMRLNSIQRRFERYRIIYVWKTLENKVPDSGVTLACEDEDRQGRKCAIRSLKPKERKKRQESFQEAGPLLFNAMPKSIRNLTGCSVDDFKEKLDLFLMGIPDEPKMGDLMPLNAEQSNSLLFQVKRRRSFL